MRAFSTRGERALPRSFQEGFTLLEVVLALTILSVGMAIVFQAVSVGQKSWGKGRERVDAATRLRVVLDVMTSQLRSAQLYDAPSGGAAQNAGREWTAGDGSSIGFVTSMPYGVDKREGLYYVRYFLSGDEGSETRALKMLQIPVYAGHPDDYGEDVEKGAMVLLPALREAAFEFAGAVEDGSLAAGAAFPGFDSRWPLAAGPGKDNALRFVRFTFGYPEGGRVEDRAATFVVYSAPGSKEAGM